MYSFGCIFCHVITEIVPSTQPQPLINPNVGYQGHDRFSAPTLEKRMSQRMNISSLTKTKSYAVDDWYVKKRQYYIDMISDNSLRQLAEACLQCDPQSRPHMLHVYNRITRIMAGEFM